MKKMVRSLIIRSSLVVEESYLVSQHTECRLLFMWFRWQLKGPSASSKLLNIDTWKWENHLYHTSMPVFNSDMTYLKKRTVGFLYCFFSLGIMNSLHTSWVCPDPVYQISFTGSFHRLFFLVSCHLKFPKHELLTLCFFIIVCEFVI